MKQQEEGSNRQKKRINRAKKGFPYTGSRRNRRATKRLEQRQAAHADTLRKLSNNEKGRTSFNNKPGKIDVK